VSAAAGRLRLASDHPALPGHFPGRPLVPGVLLLDAVLEAAAALGLRPPLRLLRAKFAAPLLPEQEAEIRLRPLPGGRVAFALHRAGDDVPLASGELAPAADGDASAAGQGDPPAAAGQGDGPAAAGGGAA